MFHFWLNTFFVDQQLQGSLAHDLTGSNPIFTSTDNDSNENLSARSHMHHASGSSEDSDDIPFTRSGNGVVTFDIGGGVLVGAGGGGGSSNPASRQNSVLCSHPSSTEEVTNLVKHASISDDFLLQERKVRVRNLSANMSILPGKTKVPIKHPINWAGVNGTPLHGVFIGELM